MADVYSLSETSKNRISRLPSIWVNVLGLRAVLRSLPYAFNSGVPRNWIRKNSVSVFRALFVNWALPHGDDNYGVSRNSAYEASVKSANLTGYGKNGNISRQDDRGAYFVAFGAAFLVTGEGVFSSIFGNASAASNYESDIWHAINEDIDLIETWGDLDTNAAANRLRRTKLWPTGMPKSWQDAWSLASDRLRQVDIGYEVWIEWFERRVAGNVSAFRIRSDKARARDKSIVERLVNSSDLEFWDKGPKHVNTTLKSWIDDAEQKAALSKVSKNEDLSFFISYATTEESFAREIVEILSELGHQSVAQFKDFAQGNFVRQMREGIAGTDRFIALQSKAYWNSDHCQSEWDAAHRRDPGSRDRKIVPFLLEPAPLPPIASEIVYKPLFNLTKAQRRKAIIEWIEYKPVSRTPSQLRKRLAEQASPDVSLAMNKIDAGPNSQFDKPLVDLDLAELPSNLRALLKVIMAALPRNAPPIVASCLNGYYEHLIERGAQPIVGTLVPFSEAIQAQVLAESGYWDAGLESLFENFFKRHELLITHFPLNPDRELVVAETVVDELMASGNALLDPVVKVGDALADLKSADLTTEDFDRVEEAHQEFSRDIASLPMPVGGNEVTPRRRYVLGTIGFYERLLAALGAGAGIASLPQGQAAILAVRGAIEAFMKFIV